MSAPNVITLDNFSTQLQPWRPDDDSHLYAIVDMGRSVKSLWAVHLTGRWC